MHVGIDLVHQYEGVLFQRFVGVTVDLVKPLHQHAHPTQKRDCTLADRFERYFPIVRLEKYATLLHIHLLKVDLESKCEFLDRPKELLEEIATAAPVRARCAMDRSSDSRG